MNYLNGNITYNAFTFDHYQALYNDGSIIDGGASSGLSSPKEIIYNLATRNEKGMPLMVYAPISNNAGYFFFNVNVDYIYFGVQSYQCQFKLKKMGDETIALCTSSNYSDSYTYCNTYDETIDAFGSLNGFAFSEMYYSQYDTHFTIDSRQSVFDLSMLQNYFGDLSGDLSPHVFNALESRPDNSLYYKYCLYVSGYNLSTNSMTIHNASDTRGTSNYQNYMNGYSNGYGYGYNEGYLDGFQEGNNNNASGEVANAFTYIGGAFTAINNIMSLEVLPNITLGLAWSIPLVIVLIFTIFKLIKR